MATTELSGEDLKQLLAFSIELSREAGKTILRGSEAILGASSEDVQEKKNSVDLVTQFDQEVEDLVREKINKTYPNFGL